MKALIKRLKDEISTFCGDGDDWDDGYLAGLKTALDIAEDMILDEENKK